MSELLLSVQHPIPVENGGLFISRGEGRHPKRKIRSHELILVRSGVLHIQEESNHFDVKQGESLILFPDRQHGGTRDYSADLSFYWVHFHTLAVTDSPALRVTQHSKLQRPEVAFEIFQRFLSDQETSNLTEYSASLLIQLLLSECVLEQNDEEEQPISALVKQANRYIQQHFTKPLTTLEIASHLGCNPDYLGRIYHTVMSRTLHESLNAARIKEACRLLTESGDSINSIARKCGFESHTYFCRVFKQIRGVSPMRHRQIYTREHVITS